MGKLLKIVGAVALGLFALMLVIGIAASEKTPAPGPVSALNSAANPVAARAPEATQQIITVDAKALVRDYVANELAADAKYKDRTLRVKGRVEAIGKDVLDHPYLSLRSSDVIRSVQCLLSTESVSVAMGLSKGTTVTVRGSCEGLMMNVLLNDCVIEAH